MQRRFDPDLDHRRSVRLQGHDYTRGAVVFVTICTHERAVLLGRIVEGEMMLSQAGRIASRCWKQIPEHFAGVDTDEFTVMPNHIHGILMIGGTAAADDNARHALTATRSAGAEMFGRPVRGSLATIVRSFKSAVTREINGVRGAPGAQVWQRNYYEHVVSDVRDLDRIRDYIAANPMNWPKDDLYMPLPAS